jgi:DNA invertase Pin-like site-specific DNA recombinase
MTVIDPAAAARTVIVSRAPRVLVVIYIRISVTDINRASRETRGQGREAFDHALAAKAEMHARECRRYAEDMGWTVIAEYIDNGKSASRLADPLPEGVALTAGTMTDHLPNRKAMFTWIEAQRRQHVIILTTEVARIARQKAHGVYIQGLARHRTLDIALSTGTLYQLNTPDGEKGFADAVAAAEHESLTISARRRRRERERAEDGGYWGTNDPFGNTRVYATDPETGIRDYTGDLDVNETEAALIREAARLIIEHDGRPRTPGSLRQVTLAWRDAGVRSKITGKPLGQPQVRAILLNKRLKGIRVHRAGTSYGRADRKSDGVESDGKWKDRAILDEDTFERVTLILTRPGRRLSESTARVYVLAGLVFCDVCGTRLKGHRSTERYCGGPDGGKCGIRLTAEDEKEGNPCGKCATHGNIRKRLTITYICPDEALGGGRHVRVNAKALEDHVTRYAFTWLESGGPYAQYAAAAEERKRATGGAARKAEIEDRERELRTLNRQNARDLAEPENAPIRESIKQSMRDVAEELYQLSDEKAAIDAAGEADGAEPEKLTIPEEWDSWDVEGRHDWIAQLVERVIVRPQNQGRRFLNPNSVDVIAGPWADGIDPVLLAVPDPDDQRMRSVGERVAAWLADHPGATGKEVAAGVGVNWSYAYVVLDMLEARDEVIRYRPGRGRGGGKAPMRFALVGTDPASLAPEPREPVPYAGRSRGKVTGWLADRPWSTIDEVAAGAGVSWSTARRTLAMLDAEGTAASRLQDLPAGFVKRPCMQFALIRRNEAGTA